MTLRIFSIQHDRQGLSQVERISARLDGVAEQLHAYDGVTGTVVLSTCNRVEVLLDTEGEGAQYRYIVAVDTDEFWAIVAKHARALPAGANAIYTNADGAIELVEMSAEDEVLEVIATLTEAQELAIYAGETEYRAVGADVSLGDGDTLCRLADR